MAKVNNDEDDASPTGNDERSSESPSEPLPIYQQRDNYFSWISEAQTNNNNNSKNIENNKNNTATPQQQRRKRAAEKMRALHTHIHNNTN